MGKTWRVAAAVGPLASVAVWAAWHRGLLTAGGRDLVAADRTWLAAAFAATALGWVAIAVARQGTVLEPLPAGRLLATQFAATAANQLTPAGIGAGAVNLRFLRACGLPLARTSAALALYSLAESVGRVALLTTMLLVFPHALRVRGLVPDRGTVEVAAAALAVAAAAAVTLVVAIRPARRLVGGFLVTALADARSLHMRPARALALWGGSLAFPALQAAGLVAVAHALALPVPAANVAVAYLAATCLAAGIPTPGGVGSVDAALGLALVAAGSPATAATSAVLGYRIITAWLPLLPAALTLGALVRRKVV
ncbi:flippase-like domain-containing protein [Streptomyces sp. NBC_00433]